MCQYIDTSTGPNGGSTVIVLYTLWSNPICEPKSWSKHLEHFPLPPRQCWVSQVKHLLHYLAHFKDLNFVQEGWGKILFISVYCQLAANSIEKHVNHCQNLLAVIVDGYVLPQENRVWFLWVSVLR